MNLSKLIPGFALLAVFGNALVLADTIAIIGTGEVAGALGPEFAKQGHTIVYGSRDPDRPSVRELVQKTGKNASARAPAESVADADIVVLAVPGLLVGEVTASLGDLTGKIIIDPTNPLERKDGRLVHGVETSNSEIIQAAAPGADVVKAFNTLNWRTMVDPASSGGPVSIPLVGNSEAAKQKVAALVRGMELEPIDLGGLENARWVEGMLILWINNRINSRQSFDYYLRPDR
jgi:8-hydroxy-5-deazaflavin:NADPH oxidoreductase